MPGGQNGAGADGGDGGGEPNAYAGGGYVGGGGGSGFISADSAIVVAGEFLTVEKEGDGLVRITYPVACPAG